MTIDQKRHKDDYIKLLNQFENDFDNMTPSDHKYFLRLQELYFKDFDPRIFSAYDTILDQLEEIGNNQYRNSGICGIFSHLIEMMGEEDFNDNFTQMCEYYDNYENFAFNYHKQFRQVDMYNMQGAIQIGRKTIEKDPEKYEKLADKRDAYIQGGYMLFRIGGHLDMIFWNAVHSDQDDIWDKVLKYTYVKYQHSKGVMV